MNKQQTLIMMVGIPGSGKSTLARKFKEEIDGLFGYESVEIISRDAIRFSMITDGEDYFSREEDVVKVFYERINNATAKYVIIDATHISKNSRAKVLNKVDKNKYRFTFAIVADTPLEICLERNQLRTGRECVPESAIINMWKGLTFPEESEGFTSIIYSKENEAVIKGGL